MEDKIRVFSTLDELLLAYKDICWKSVDTNDYNYPDTIIRNRDKIEALGHKILAFYTENEQLINKHLGNEVVQMIDSVHVGYKDSHINSLRKGIVIAQTRIRKQANIPVYTDNKLQFLGTSVSINGSKVQEATKLLLDNTGSIVDEDTSTSLYKQVRSQIYANSIFKDVFVFVEKQGFGVFIDQNKLLKYANTQSPQISPQNQE